MEQEQMQEVGNLAQAKRDWEELISNPAWLSLIQAIQAQADTLQNEILFGPVESTGDLYMAERKKGMLEGRLSITATAAAMLESIGYDYQQAVANKE
jgi:hypothetical protein